MPSTAAGVIKAIHVELGLNVSEGIALVTIEAEGQTASAPQAAKAEAQRIIQDAEKKAAELVEEENIVRRAKVESEELRESAKEDAANLHRNTLDYIDSLLAETDRKMSELINNIRLERNEIRNRR